MNNHSTTLLVRLSKLADSLDVSHDLGAALGMLATETCRLLDAENASVMLSDGKVLRVYAHHGRMPEAAYAEVVRKGQGVSGQVFENGRTLFLEDITRSDFARHARYPATSGNSLMVSPVMIDGKIAGVINVSSPRYRQAFSADEASAFQVITQFHARTIQVIQLRNLLDSRFAVTAMAMRRRPSNREKLVEQALDPEKIPRILAKSFYRELRRAGFDSAQIINAATEIISELGGSLRKKQE